MLSRRYVQSDFRFPFPLSFCGWVKTKIYEIGNFKKCMC